MYFQNNLNQGDIYSEYTSGAGGIVGSFSIRDSSVQEEGVIFHVASNVSVSRNIEIGSSASGNRIIGSKIEIDNYSDKFFTDYNYGLASCVISQNGKNKNISEDKNNGKSIEESTLKSADFYKEIGWDFDSIWTIDEGESFPYHKSQTAPPSIQRIVVGTTKISGKAVPGATVYVVVVNDESYETYEAYKTYETTATGNGQWKVRVPAVQGTDNVYAYAKVVGKDYSNFAYGEVYDAEHNLQIIPAQIAVGSDETKVKLLMANKQADEISSVKFDLVLPDGISLKQDDDANEYIEAGSRINPYRFGFNISKNADNSRSIQARNTVYKGTFSGTEGDIAILPLVADADLADGIYTIELRNIVFNNNTDLKILPYKASFFVGRPQVTDAKLYGRYNAEAVEALTGSLTDPGVASLDMTEATFDEPCKITLTNPNALIYVNEDATLGNSQNVVTDEQCKKLVLTDGSAFSAPLLFTAERAEYTRSVVSQFGTLCLPYAVHSDDAVKYYSIDRIEGTTLYLTEQPTVAAGVPVVFECVGGTGSLSATADDAPVSGTLTTSGNSDLTLVGSYKPLVITDTDELKRIYYIREDRFRQATNSLTVNPFRAYIGNVAAERSKVLDISTGTLTGIAAGLDEAGSAVVGIYDVKGVKHEALQPGVNLVKYENGETRKIIVR